MSLLMRPGLSFRLIIDASLMVQWKTFPLRTTQRMSIAYPFCMPAIVTNLPCSLKLMHRGKTTFVVAK